jgi:hypothetical protein
VFGEAVAITKVLVQVMEYGPTGGFTVNWHGDWALSVNDMNAESSAISFLMRDKG